VEGTWDDKEGDLADGLEFGPGVGATHFHRWVIEEDVVAKIIQWRLGVCGGKLSAILNLLPYFNINLLQKMSVFSETAEMSMLHILKYYGVIPILFHQ